MDVPIPTKIEKSETHLNTVKLIKRIYFSLTYKSSLKDFYEIWDGIPQVYTNYANQPGEDVAGCSPKYRTSPLPYPRDHLRTRIIKA